MTKLDATAEQQIKDLKTCYEAMTGYQLGQLTGKEQKKYDAVVKALSDGLAPAIQRKLTFQQQFDSSIPAADQAALNSMIAYLQDSTRVDDKYTPEIGGNMQGKLFAFSTRKYVNYGNAYTQITEAPALTQDIYACINPDYTAYFLCRDAAVSAGQAERPRRHLRRWLAHLRREHDHVRAEGERQQYHPRTGPHDLYGQR